MRRAVLKLALLVLALLLVERGLAVRAARSRAETRRVGMLFTREEAERLRKQPALRIEASGESHAYGRIEGQWRCLSYHQAPADGRALQALLDGIVQAEGIVHAATSEEAPAFGINTPHTLRVSIQGPRAGQDPAGDVLATLEIGASERGREGCFVRRKGTREIWSIASDLRVPIERRLGPDLPPLLEPALVPGAWLELGGAVRIVLERAGTRTSLERRERALDPSEMTPGALPWKWVLVPPAPDSPAHEIPESFVSFLERLPYVAVLDPARRAELVPEPASASVTLETPQGPAVRLEFGPASADALAVWVPLSGTLYQLDADMVELALPTQERLTAPPASEDPWSAALRAQR